MQPLEHPDLFHVNAAQGWLDLGNAAEATTELGHISSGLQNHPEVLEVAWQIAVKQTRWLDALTISEQLCALVPDNAFGWIHRSFCLHELKRTREAWDTLLPMAETFPREWLLRYNLACYACQLGRLEESKAWLGRAAELLDRDAINRLAAEDPDLKPLFQQAP